MTCKAFSWICSTLEDYTRKTRTRITKREVRYKTVSNTIPLKESQNERGEVKQFLQHDPFRYEGNSVQTNVRWGKGMVGIEWRWR